MLFFAVFQNKVDCVTFLITTTYLAHSLDLKAMAYKIFGLLMALCCWLVGFYSS